MSRNIAKHQLEHQAVTQIKQLQQHARSRRTTQPQGSQAIRLSVVEGYLRHTLDFGQDLYTEFVEIEAAEDETILIGSLTHSSFMVIYDTNWPEYPAAITTLDTDNAGWGGVVYNTWMTAALSPDDPDYSSVGSLGGLTDNAMPQHRIRIGSRVYLRQGLWTTSTVEIFTFYQVRMTIGWNE